MSCAVLSFKNILSNTANTKLLQHLQNIPAIVLPILTEVTLSQCADYIRVVAVSCMLSTVQDNQPRIAEPLAMSKYPKPSGESVTEQDTG